MNNKCKCGGKMIRVSNNPSYFKYRCDTCKKVNKQSKRRKGK